MLGGLPKGAGVEHVAVGTGVHGGRQRDSGESLSRAGRSADGGDLLRPPEDKHVFGT